MGRSTVKPSPYFLLIDLPNSIALDFIDSKNSLLEIGVEGSKLLAL